MHLEVVPWYPFHTKSFGTCNINASEQYYGKQRLTFFSDIDYRNLQTSEVEDTNQVIPGMFPNPCSFLIEGIRIFGLPSALCNGRFRLQIGNKIYADTNVMAYIERWKIPDIAMMIAPLQCFQAWIEWKFPQMFGGRIPVITVMFKGKMARAVC